VKKQWTGSHRSRDGGFIDRLRNNRQRIYKRYGRQDCFNRPEPYNRKNSETERNTKIRDNPRGRWKKSRRKIKEEDSTDKKFFGKKIQGQFPENC
jgi:hypothetical protein